MLVDLQNMGNNAKRLQNWACLIHICTSLFQRCILKINSHWQYKIIVQQALRALKVE